MIVWTMSTSVPLSLQASVEANRPPGSKGIYWKTMHICSTMGPSVKIDLASMKALAKASA